MEIPFANPTFRVDEENETAMHKERRIHDFHVTYGIQPDNAMCEDDEDEESDSGDSDGYASDESNNGDFVMFPVSGITRNDILNVLHILKIKFNFTQKQIDGIAEALKISAGPEFASVSLSNYQLSHMNEIPENVIQLIFFCTECYIEIGTSTLKEKGHSVSCVNCQKEYELSKDKKNFFVTVDIEFQLQKLLLNEEIKKALFEKLQARYINEDNITDICNGSLYKKAVSDNPCVLPLIFSTDGAPVNNQGQRSFWPLQVCLVDLPPHLRQANILLAGIMIPHFSGKHEMMNLFLQSFISQIERVNSAGVNFQINDEDVTMFLEPLICSVDSAARPVLQQRIQYNGFFGCSFCYDHGTYCKGCVRFDFKDCSLLRTHDSHMEDIQNAENTKTSFRGVKERSVLCDCQYFDSVWGYAFDSMHTVALGVAKQVLYLLISQKILTAKDREKINLRLLQIQPAHDLNRLPESLDHKGKWKATQWKSWLLFWSIPVMFDLLPEENLEHYALLVRAIFTLSKTEITPREMKNCEIDLIKFVGKFQILYKMESMTFNVHLLLHAVDSVRKCGPLWAISTFVFERAIFSYKKMVNGPKGVEDQMAKNWLLNSHIKSSQFQELLSPTVQTFCETIISTKKNTDKSVMNEEVRFFGKPKNVNYLKEEYSRCWFQNHVLATSSYCKGKKQSDCCVQLMNGDFGEILSLYNCHENGNECKIRQIVVENLSIGSVVLPHIFKVVSEGVTELVSFTNIKCKATMARHETLACMCIFPNNIEPQ